MIALLSNDLMFQSRISSTAKAIGATLISARSAEQLLERVKANAADHTPPSLTLIDLTLSSLDVAGDIAMLRGQFPTMDIVAYGPHVDVERLQLAAEAGARAITRGQMDRDMASILATATSKP